MFVENYTYFLFSRQMTMQTKKNVVKLTGTCTILAAELTVTDSISYLVDRQ